MEESGEQKNARCHGALIRARRVTSKKIGSKAAIRGIELTSLHAQRLRARARAGKRIGEIGGNPLMLAFAFMSKIKTALLLAAAFVFAAFLAAQGPIKKDAPSGTDPAFARFVDDYFDSRFAAGPLEGSGAGFHQYDAKMPDRSRAAIEKRVADLKGQLQRLTAFDRAKLPFDDAIDAQVLEGDIRGELLDLDTLRNWKNNPMGYTATPAVPSTA